MKKIISIVALFCSVSIYAQECGSANDILIEAKKDYLYHLAQLNIADNGNKYRTYIRFVDYENDSPNLKYIRSRLQRVPTFQKMKIKWQIEQADFLIFHIKRELLEQENYTLYDGMYVEVFFVLLKNTSGFTKKSGKIETAPTKAPGSCM